MNHLHTSSTCKNFVLRACAVTGLGAVLLLTLPAAEAASRWSRRAGLGQQARGERPLERLADRLDLTAAQRAQIKAVLKSHEKELRLIAEERRTDRQELRELIHTPAATEVALRAASAKLAEVEAEAVVLRHRILQEIRPILTTAQLEELQEIEERIEKLLEAARERRGQFFQE